MGVTVSVTVGVTVGDYEWKKHCKLKIMWVKIVWIWENQTSTHNYAYEIDQCNHINKFGDFDRQTPTYKGITHAKKIKIEFMIH